MISDISYYTHNIILHIIYYILYLYIVLYVTMNCYEWCVPLGGVASVSQEESPCQAPGLAGSESAGGRESQQFGCPEHMT